MEIQGIELGLRKYIDGRGTRSGVAVSDSYAFSGDLVVLRTMRRLTPVKVAVEAAVRILNAFYRNELLGSAVLVTPDQFPEIHELGMRCSKILGVPEQQIYVIQALGSINAMTIGTEEESLVILHSATIDHLSEQELLYVIGHEFGHIQNSHVVYNTTLNLLLRSAAAFIKWIVAPALLALKHWSRRAEITADRAGLLCCKDLEVAQRASAKLALGSHELYQKLDLEEYLKQLEQGRENFSRVVELWRTHPYMPKRIASLRLFAESAYYRDRMGLSGGMDKATLDAEVAKIIKVL